MFGFSIKISRHTSCLISKHVRELMLCSAMVLVDEFMKIFHIFLRFVWWLVALSAPHLEQDTRPGLKHACHSNTCVWLHTHTNVRKKNLNKHFEVLSSRPNKNHAKCYAGTLFELTCHHNDHTALVSQGNKTACTNWTRVDSVIPSARLDSATLGVMTLGALCKFVK